MNNGFNFSPTFSTIGENALCFHDEMGKDMEKKVAVIHGERAWKAAREYVVPLEKAGLTRLLQNGCMDMMQPLKTLIRSQMILQYRKADMLMQ